MPVFLHLQGVFSGTRDEGTARVQRALDAAGASLTDVRFFSGVMTVFTFETEAADAPKLLSELELGGIVLTRSPLENFPGSADVSANDRANVLGTLSVTFTEGDPDLRNDVPAIPG